MSRSRVVGALAVCAALSLGVSAATLDTTVFEKSVALAVGSGKYAGGELENFPVLVRLSKASGFQFSDFTTPADELRFADAEGNSLDFEIDTWDESLGALVWVSVPKLAADTTITAYFVPADGAELPAVSSTAVWTKADYIGVWHFNDADGTAHADATGHGLTATPKSTAFEPFAAGAVGQAFKANGTGAFLPSDVIVTYAETKNSLSGEAWVDQNGTTANQQILRSGDGWDNGAGLRLNDRIYYGSGNYNQWSGAVPASGWAFISAAWTDQSGKGYVNLNGTMVLPNVARYDNNTDFSAFSLTSRTDGDEPFLGYVDEFRLRKGVSSSDWVAANYATQSDADFFDYGAVVVAGAAIEGGEATASDVAWTTATLATEFTVDDSVSGDVAVTLTLTPDGGTAYDVPAGTVSAASGAVSFVADDLLPGTAYTAVFAVTHDGNTVYSGTASFTTVALPGPTVSDVGDTAATVGAAFTLAGASYTGVTAVFSDGTTVAAAFADGAWTATASSLEDDSDYTVYLVVARNDGTTFETASASFTTTGTVTLDPRAYRARQTMTATGYSGSETLAFFPVLVRVPADVAKTVKNAADIRFADAEGTLLYHEIDTWDASGESLIWVSLRSLVGTDTSFTMYWNPASGANVPAARPSSRVWTRAGYVAVYHMADANWTDSSGVSGAPTASNVDAPAVYSSPSPLGASYKGKQNTSSLLIPKDKTAKWDFSDGFTLETWVNASEAESNWRRTFAAGESWSNGCETFGATSGNTGYYMCYLVDSTANWARRNYPQTILDGGWGHFSFVYDGTEAGAAARDYVNGEAGANTDRKVQTGGISFPNGMGLVSLTDKTNGFLGALDEMRVRAKASSADWAQATWATAAANSDFLTYGEAKLAAGLSVIVR